MAGWGAGYQGLHAQELSAAAPKGFVELPLTTGPRVLVPTAQVLLVEEQEGAQTVVDLVGGRVLRVGLGYDEVRQRIGER